MTSTASPDTIEIEVQGLDAEWLALNQGTDPTDLPEWLTADEPRKEDEPVKGRHAKRYCPWTDVVVPEPATSTAVADAAQAAALDGYGGFLKSPTAKHAHDGATAALLAFAAVEIEAVLAQRSVPRRRLRDLVAKLKAVL